MNSFKLELCNDDFAVVEKIETRTVELTQPYDNELVVYITRELAKKAGFNTTDEFMIASSASELVTNILRYAIKGQITISIIKKDGHNGIEIFASDNGPGIKDINLAMQENYTTTERSLGMGLPSVKRIMDEFKIESYEGQGTHVIGRKWC